MFICQPSHRGLLVKGWKGKAIDRHRKSHSAFQPPTPTPLCVCVCVCARARLRVCVCLDLRTCLALFSTRRWDLCQTADSFGEENVGGGFLIMFYQYVVTGFAKGIICNRESLESCLILLLLPLLLFSSVCAKRKIELNNDRTELRFMKRVLLVSKRWSA